MWGTGFCRGRAVRDSETPREAKLQAQADRLVELMRLAAFGPYMVR